MDLRAVQALMGHRDINTTMRYAHQSPEHLRGAVARLGYSSADERMSEVLAL